MLCAQSRNNEQTVECQIQLECHIFLFSVYVRINRSNRRNGEKFSECVKETIRQSLLEESENSVECGKNMAMIGKMNCNKSQ